MNYGFVVNTFVFSAILTFLGKLISNEHLRKSKGQRVKVN